MVLNWQRQEAINIFQEEMGGKGIRSYAAIENDENENDYKYLVQIALVDGKSYILGTNKYKDIWYQFDIMSNNIFSNHLQNTKKGFKSLSENSERYIVALAKHEGSYNVMQGYGVKLECDYDDYVAIEKEIRKGFFD